MKHMRHLDKPCWEWPGIINRQGYGMVGLPGDGRRVPAHRWTWEQLVGPIPAGLQIDHLCRNKACVNPAHLEPVTARVNILRSTGIAAVNAAKTHCIRGHEFTLENTMTTSSGHRSCRMCRAAARRRWYERKRALKTRSEQAA